MADLVFGSPVTTMAILSRIETSRQDEAHLRFGAQPTSSQNASIQSPLEESVPEKQLVGVL
jgi:hypothetical protein